MFSKILNTWMIIANCTQTSEIVFAYITKPYEKGGVEKVKIEKNSENTIDPDKFTGT